jgi:hypothetical protein
MNLTEWEIFDEFTNRQIFGAIVIVLVFLYLVFTTIKILFTYMRDNDD